MLNFSDDVEAWISILKKLGEFDIFKNTVFYKINKIFETPEYKNQEIFIEKIKEKTGLILKKRKEYGIDLNYYAVSYDASRENIGKIGLSIDRDSIWISQKEINLGAKYDYIRFYLNTADSKSTITTLSISSKTKDVVAPIISIPIKVKTNILDYALPFIGFLLASGAFGAIPYWIPWLNIFIPILAGTLGSILITIYIKNLK